MRDKHLGNVEVRVLADWQLGRRVMSEGRWRQDVRREAGCCDWVRYRSLAGVSRHLMSSLMQVLHCIRAPLPVTHTHTPPFSQVLNIIAIVTHSWSIHHSLYYCIQQTRSSGNNCHLMPCTQTIKFYHLQMRYGMCSVASVCVTVWMCICLSVCLSAML